LNLERRATHQEALVMSITRDQWRRWREEASRAGLGVILFLELALERALVRILRLCRMLRIGHSHHLVHSVAFSPDGKTVASGGIDALFGLAGAEAYPHQTIKLWDAQAGALKRTLTGHSNLVWSLAFSLDGKTLVSGSFDRTVRLWDAHTGALQHTLTGNTDAVTSVAFSPDGRTVASSGGWNGTVRLWDAQTGALKSTLSAADGKVDGVTFSPDGKTIAGWGHVRKTDDVGAIWLWDSLSGQLKATLQENEGLVYLLAFAPDRKILVSGGSGDLKWWDADTGELKQALEGHDRRWLAFSPDGRTLVSGSRDGTVKLWDAETGVLKRTLMGRGKSVAFAPDGKALVSGGAQGVFKGFRVLHPDMGYLGTIVIGQLKMWDVETGQLKWGR
jgi:WD40 repeat protein